MKIHVMSLFLGVMACLCTFVISCKNDSADDPDKPNENEGAVYFSIKVTGAGGPSSRAPQTEEGTANESKVNRILVVLYHISTGNVEYQFPMDIHSGSSSAIEGSDLYQSGTAKRFQTVARQVERQDYHLLVVLNPREAILAATTEGSHISTFNTVAELKDVTDLTGAHYDDFLMSNWQDLVFADANTFLFDTEEEALSNPVPVCVERAVSKVVVDGTAKGGNAFSLEGWTLNVVNRKTYWMRRPWLALRPNGAGAVNETESPEVAERYLNYAKDPNAARDQYAGMAWHSYGAWLAHGGTGDAPAYPNEDFTFIHSASAAWEPVGTTHWLYAPENTMEAAQQYGDVTTSVILKAKYHPAKSALGATIGSGAPYFTYYKGKSRYIFTAGELDAEYTWQENHEGEPRTYTDPQIQEFMNNIGQYRALLEEGVAFTAYASDASNASCNLRKDFGFFDSTHLNYYRIPIPHFSKAEQPDPMGYGRYGVVRNNIYKLTIDEVYGPGTVEIASGKSGSGNPGDPGDPPGEPGNPEGPDNPYGPNDPNDPDGPVGPGNPDGPGGGDDPGDDDGPKIPDDPPFPGEQGEQEDDTHWLSFRVHILDWTIRTHGVSAGEE